MTADKRQQIKTDVYYITNRGRAITRFVAAIDGAWLKRKDGGIRKFQTRYAARLAAQAEADKAKA